MEDSTRNVFDYKKIKQINATPKESFKNKELIQKMRKQYNQKHSKIINVILFEIILIILPKINRLFECWIQIKVNRDGENQILSNEYIGVKPSIYINDNLKDLNDKTINVGTINDIILMKWNSPISNFAYMFENLETITYAYINYMPGQIMQKII